MMNSVEIKNAIRDTATRAFIAANPDALAILEKPYTFVIPVEVEGKTYYAKWGCTSVQYADTKARPAFDPETDAIPAAESFENMLLERAANKAAAEEKRKAKSKSKSSNE